MSPVESGQHFRSNLCHRSVHKLDVILHGKLSDKPKWPTGSIENFVRLIFFDKSKHFDINFSCTEQFLRRVKILVYRKKKKFSHFFRNGKILYRRPGKCNESSPSLRKKKIFVFIYFKFSDTVSSTGMVKWKNEIYFPKSFSLFRKRILLGGLM